VSPASVASLFEVRTGGDASNPPGAVLPMGCLRHVMHVFRRAIL
jgi:hypothetical protein